MFNRFANFHFVTRAALMVLLIASPWLVVQVGIAILGPDREITEMPVCEANSGNCAHLGGGDDYRLNDIYPTSLNQSSNLVYDKLIDFIDSKDLELIFHKIINKEIKLEPKFENFDIDICSKKIVDELNI